MTDLDLGAVRAGYEALRHGIGAYRLPVDVVTVVGPEATAYLQGQLSQDLGPLESGRSAPALLLEPDGKLTALVRATKLAEDAWALDTDRGYGEAVAARLTRFRLRTKVEIATVGWSFVALRGAGVAAALPSSAPGDSAPGGTEPSTLVLPVEWNGTVGADLLGPGAEGAVPPGAHWCDAAAWAALRVEAGIPSMGAELDARTIAAEAGLVERTVSFTKGCYTGQELVARLDARGSRVARRLCGVVVADLEPGDAPGLVGASLWRAAEGGGGGRGPERAKPVGRCTSAAWCPGLEAVGALCYLHRSVDVPADVVWTAAAESADADGETERVDPDRTGRPALARPIPLVAP